MEQRPRDIADHLDVLRRAIHSQYRRRWELMMRYGEVDSLVLAAHLDVLHAAALRPDKPPARGRPPLLYLVKTA